jgi:hypothetical protein
MHMIGGFPNVFVAFLMPIQDDESLVLLSVHPEYIHSHEPTTHGASFGNDGGGGGADGLLGVICMVRIGDYSASHKRPLVPGNC